MWKVGMCSAEIELHHLVDCSFLEEDAPTVSLAPRSSMLRMRRHRHPATRGREPSSASHWRRCTRLQQRSSYLHPVSCYQEGDTAWWLDLHVGGTYQSSPCKWPVQRPGVVRSNYLNSSECWCFNNFEQILQQNNLNNEHWVTEAAGWAIGSKKKHTENIPYIH